MTSSENNGESAFDHQAKIEAIAAENGVFSDLVKERAERDPFLGGLLRCAEKLKRVANNSTTR
jgi:hypothetical protein